MASTRLTFTQGTPTDGTAWTYSGWIKIADGTDTNTYALITSYQGTNNDRILIDSSRRIHVEFKDGASTVYEQHPTAKLRDTNGWYHVVVAFDSSEAQADRVKIYLNGTRLTDMDIDQELTTSGYTTKGFNASTKVMDVGTYNAAGSYLSFFDGSMAHVHFTDGTAYAASDFGETDATTGQWKPKTSPSVTYGTNGFFLKFANSGSMGTDSSGNGNNFTVAAGTLTQTQDTPSNVFATWNPLHRNRTVYNDEGPGQVSLTNLNTTATGPSGSGGAGYSHTISTLGFTQGKWYAEFKLISDLNAMLIALVKEGWDGGSFGTIDAVGGSTFQFGNGQIKVNTTVEATVSSPSLNDIINVAVDADNQKIWYGVNGTWQGSGTQNPSTGDGGYDYSFVGDSVMFFGFSDGGASLQPVMSANFGNGYFGTTAVSSANSDDAGYGLFEYAPPTGFYSLCTKNINTYG